MKKSIKEHRLNKKYQEHGFRLAPENQKSTPEWFKERSFSLGMAFGLFFAPLIIVISAIIWIISYPNREVRRHALSWMLGSMLVITIASIIGFIFIIMG